MKTLLTGILFAASLISAAPQNLQVNSTHLLAAMTTPLTEEKTTVTVTNTISDLVCLLDLPDESLSRLEIDLTNVATSVNGQRIMPGESKEFTTSMLLVSLELPAKVCTELIKDWNIFKKIGFSAVAWATNLKVVFLIPVDTETGEIDLLHHLINKLEQWETQPPKSKINFKFPFTFFVTIGGN